jgi:ankyrin repeat protein
LHFATKHGHLEIVKYLIVKCHVDQEAKTNNGQSAYDIAITYNKSEVVQYLLAVSDDTAGVNDSDIVSAAPSEKAAAAQVRFH